MSLPRHLLHPLRRAYATTAATPKLPIKTVFSGIQPTGVPHLGNYFGALKQWVELQNTAAPSTKLIYCIVDLHAITQPIDAKILHQNRLESLATLLAIGIDPERSILFEQSAVPAHAELMWILSCGASTGYLSRMTQWKSKSGLDKDAADSPIGDSTAKLKLGLFSYPVLQAADILVHRATDVPVGEDQLQHLEFTRDVAKGFNHTYKTKVFPQPQTNLSPARRVMSLLDPLKKMSKSDPHAHSRILLTDESTTIRKRISRAMTDSLDGITYDPTNRPGISNLLEIYGHSIGRSDFAALAKEQFDGAGAKELKQKTADVLVESLTPIREEYARIMGKGPEYLEEVARVGAVKARDSAKETMDRVRATMGLPSLV